MRRLLALALLCLPLSAAPASATPIVGGAETEKAWPFMLYVDQGRQEIDLGDQQYCGGSLIAPTWAMTAAHCINHELIDPLLTTVVIGRHAKSDADAGERIQVRRVIVHEDYASGGPDIALFELERAPEGAAPIKIAGPGEEPLYAPGTMATALGWGLTSEGGSSSDVLKEAQVPIVADEPCGKTYEAPSWGWDASIMICAGFPEGGTDTCQGDSGGPLIVPAPDGSLRQVGITSFGEGCARANWPGVYTEAASPRVREWVAALVPGAVAPPAPAPKGPPPSQSAPQSPPAQSQSPSGSAPAPPQRSAPKPKAKAKPSKALKRCLKKAGRSKRKQRACRRAEAKRQKRAAARRS